MVDQDIIKCELFEKESHSYQEKRLLFIELVSKYSAHIAGLGDGLMEYRQHEQVRHCANAIFRLPP